MTSLLRAAPLLLLAGCASKFDAGSAQSTGSTSTGTSMTPTFVALDVATTATDPLHVLFISEATACSDLLFDCASPWAIEVEVGTPLTAGTNVSTAYPKDGSAFLTKSPCTETGQRVTGTLHVLADGTIQLEGFDAVVPTAPMTVMFCSTAHNSPKGKPCIHDEDCGGNLCFNAVCTGHG